jgi:hypothetical protein
MAPPINCPDFDGRDAAFIKAAGFIGGRDTIEEFFTCRLYPLAANSRLGEVAEGITPPSKLKVPLPKFRVVQSNEEDDVKFWARVELEAENNIGAYGCPEHEACSKPLPNRGRLN